MTTTRCPRCESEAPEWRMVAKDVPPLDYNDWSPEAVTVIKHGGRRGCGQFVFVSSNRAKELDARETRQ